MFWQDSKKLIQQMSWGQTFNTYLVKSIKQTYRKQLTDLGDVIIYFLLTWKIEVKFWFQSFRRGFWCCLNPSNLFCVYWPSTTCKLPSRAFKVPGVSCHCLVYVNERLRCLCNCLSTYAKVTLYLDSSTHSQKRNLQMVFGKTSVSFCLLFVLWITPVYIAQNPNKTQESQQMVY